MVTFLPFKALRPNHIEGRVSPPYDIISDEELDSLRSKKGNITRITLGREEGRYLGARAELDSWIADGSLVFDDEDSFYLYVQRFKADGVERTRTGIMGALRVEPYENGNIVPHEMTFPKVKEDRLNLIRDVEAHCESIFGIIDTLPEGLCSRMMDVAVPVSEYDDGTIAHTLMRVSDVDVIETLMEELSTKRVLIADGHHRYETALRYSQENPGDDVRSRILITLVSSDDPGMVVYPTHRLLTGISGSEEELLDRLSESFELVDKSDLYSFGHAMGMSDGPDVGIWTRGDKYLIARHSTDIVPNTLGSLDAFRCQEIIIKPLLERDPGVQIAFEHDPCEVGRKMTAGEVDVALMLNAPTFDLIWGITGAGDRMPKKSTYFYPKMWSGFVIYDMGHRM